jgi:hypothetical protein
MLILPAIHGRQVTPNRAANCSCVSPSCCLSSKTRVPISEEGDVTRMYVSLAKGLTFID